MPSSQDRPEDRSEDRKGLPPEFRSASVDLTGRDAENLALGEIDYVKAAFKWQYNWIALSGAAVFAIISASALPLLMAAGVELMYLSAVPQISRFRRLARSWKQEEEKRRLEWQLARVMQFLPASMRKRY